MSIEVKVPDTPDASVSNSTISVMVGEAHGNINSHESKVRDSKHECNLHQRESHLEFDNEAWYPVVENITFPTKFISLYQEQAEALIANYRFTYLNGPPLNEQHQAALMQLEALLRDEVEALCNVPDSKGVFVRLSSRSPKDAAIPSRAAFASRLERERATCRAHGWNDEAHEYNSRMVAYSAAAAEGLCVQTGEGALELLKASERVYTDLNFSLEVVEEYDTKIVLRQWDTRVRDHMEFRVFVKDDRLTAITQYNHFCYYPEVHAKCDEIKVKIISYWKEELQARLHRLGTYVVDVAILSDDSIIVVELNPFATISRAGLFDWTMDKDILYFGDAVMRVHTTPLPHLHDFVDYCLSESHLDDLVYTAVDTFGRLRQVFSCSML